MRAWAKQKKQLWGTVFGITKEDQLVGVELKLNSGDIKMLTYDAQKYDVLIELDGKPFPFSLSYLLDQKVVNVLEYPLSDNDGIIKIQVD